MTVPQCQRRWQTEAMRDGRLQGKDRDSAVRHRATCAECRQEDRELAELGHAISCLPELARDSMTAQRSRQQLIAVLNRSLFEPPASESLPRSAFALALATAAVVAGVFAIGRKFTRNSTAEHLGSVVEIRGEKDARWSERTSRELDQVDLSEGAATFTVHPHGLRRVVIQLPDGEVEDIGTVFEIRVSEQHTRHISVSVGRISVRLRGHPAFTLGAGDAWELESAVSKDSEAQNQPVRVPATPSGTPSLPTATAASGIASSLSRVAVRPRALAGPEKVSKLGSPPTSGPLDPQTQNSGSDEAEDEAYLQILKTLNRERYDEARAEAKDYLLRFPNGFRRVEVLNIAMRRSDSAGNAP